MPRGSGAAEFVVNTDDFTKAAKALKAAGATHLRGDLNDRTSKALKPLIAQTRAAAMRSLPAAGGLNRKVAGAPQRVETVRRGAEAAGARLVLVSPKGSGAAGANRGTVRHPVFGNTSRWVAQSVQAGWFDKTVAGQAGQYRRAVEEAIGETLARIAREGD